ncbi:hypothetical protein DFQ27_000580 [Actinomortierella ambigua]|uniref:FAD-binding FR-type domain-containing protein n=1 Tax=Actinomortierella ambigua TaxID=1343610 RepID=A0A9P6QDL4_9FUNG|nr:hypothetical protein DFQ27_000580 [Actinomortierella ambigua]
MSTEAFGFMKGREAKAALVDHGYQIAIVLLLVITGFYFVALDDYWTWIKRADLIFKVYNRRDWLMIPFVLIPLLAGHLITIWSHYFRTDEVFQRSIQHVTLSQHDKDLHQAAKRSQKNPTHFWHRRWWGWTYKQWVMAALIIVVNIIWFGVSYVHDYPAYRRRFGILSSFGLAFGSASGYAVLACTAWILFLILRRSMLHALGWTYSELVPFHRWLGVLITFWSTTHTIGYLIYYFNENILYEGFDFFEARGLMNWFGVFAYVALLILAVFSFPFVRRKLYGVFMALHRVMTVIFIVGTIAHFPYYMMWYYVLPSFILFLLDRFVPKYIQTRTILPTATVTMDPNGVDIMRITLRSRTPMKPYYPGDYILLQVPEIGTLYHPFTIASYYPDDPCAITLFVRIYNESRLSWTPLLAKLGGGNPGNTVQVNARVDGVFGDRVHDYFESDVCVLFVAGVALTTFTALIKSVGAQIAATKAKGDPTPAFRMYLICSFKTESEMYAYGSFLSQIMTDPRFTSWLETRIYVTRGDTPALKTVVVGEGHGSEAAKPTQPLLSAQSSIATTDTGKKPTYGSFEPVAASASALNRVLSDRTMIERSTGSSTLTSSASSLSSASSSSSSTPGPSSPWLTPTDPVLLRSSSAKTAVDEEGNHNTGNNDDDTSMLKKTRLSTFEDVNSQAEAMRLAHYDLALSFLLIFIPLVFWFLSKAIYWEGYSGKRCSLFDRNATMERTMYCLMTYSLIPGCLHFIVMSIGGYMALYLARRAMDREETSAVSAHGGDGAGGGSEEESSRLLYKKKSGGDVLLEEAMYARQARARRESAALAFERGRVEVESIMRGFIDRGIGGVLSDAETDSSNRSSSTNTKKAIRSTTVLASGPDSFVDRIEDMTKQVRWAVDFHRETWAP